MNEYYGAPNDFRAYVRHAQSDSDYNKYVKRYASDRKSDKMEAQARQYLQAMGLLSAVDSNQRISVQQYRRILELAMQKDAAAIRLILNGSDRK